MEILKAPSNTLVLNYQQEDYEKWVTDFANRVQAETINEHVQYPEEFGVGYTKAKNIEAGLSYRIVNYTTSSNLEYRRVPSEKLQLILYFYELHFNDKLYCKTSNTIIESNDKYYSIALMTNSFTHQNVKFEKGTIVKGLAIQITEDWLKENVKGFCLEKMEALKQKDCVMDFITAKQRKILSDIFNKNSLSNLPELFIKSRVLRLTEQFLDNVCNRDLSPLPKFTNQKDFEALIKIEHELTNSYNEDFPSIEKLAKQVFMSPSKLKQLFKKAYGMAIYQYYQKNRMHKAKELLNAGKHSVTQVGMFLGYQNLSNFSAAFKKEFNFLPREHKEMA